MSGFFVVLNLDGAAVDTAQLHRLTDALRFRGPDAQEVWIGEQVGFGHALLRTTAEAPRQRQPCSLDGKTWITGDVRVDRRKELLRDLEAAGQSPPPATTDAELVLYAYKAWGEALVQHLIGDFSFAIWDAKERRLFCVRDQLGVKPFFYARVGNHFIASNTLSCLRAHDAVPADLNDAAIGDYLLFGFNCEPQTTTFEAIKRLPGGHTLSCSPGSEPRIRRYWALPVLDELRLPREADYVERFQDVLAAAVSDRLRTDHVAIHMSGGLDSTLLAATARDLLAKQYTQFDLCAYTVVYEKLFHDEERYFSKLAADGLGIPIRYLVADDYDLFDECVDDPTSLPEPLDVLAQPSFFRAVNRQIDTGCRVTLSGLDGDALLTGSWSAHFASHAKAGRFASLAADVFRYAKAKRNLSGAILSRLTVRGRPNHDWPDFPVWLEPAFVQRHGLRDRWASKLRSPDLGRGAREEAYRAMTLHTWPPILEGRDAGFTGVPIEHRHPLLDLRVVEFGLSLPTIPWCVDKYILRECARNRLPEPVRLRPKSALGGDPTLLLLPRYLAELRQPPAMHPMMNRYIDVARIPEIIDEAGTAGYWLALRAFTLNFWLCKLQG